MKLVSDDLVVDAYRRLGSVWLAGDELGICGQAVHTRLKRLGIERSMPRWTTADDAVLLSEYEDLANQGRGKEFAAKMGRTPQFIARQAKRLGVSTHHRSHASRAESVSLFFKSWIQKNGHPKGMMGRKHSQKTLDVMSQKAKATQASYTEEKRQEMKFKGLKTTVDRYGSLCRERPGTTWKSGWRTIGGRKKYFRSRWEANYARYLNWLESIGEIRLWEHEPETFWFKKIKRGVCSYLPDFRVTEKSGAIVYHEVKGWMDARSSTKLDRMKKYHPDVRLIVIRGADYKALARKVSALIPDWE